MASSVFLEVVTRHMPTRDELFRTNEAGLMRQTDDDWRHTVLLDDVGRGMAWAQAQLAELPVAGQYVWLLDDDNECLLPTLVEELKAIANGHDYPDVIMMRTERGGTLFPDDYHWQRPPVMGRIDAACYVIRSDVWQRHADAWYSGRYESDFDFIDDVWSAGPRVFWHDVVASRAMRISGGAA